MADTRTAPPLLLEPAVVRPPAPRTWRAAAVAAGALVALLVTVLRTTRVLEGDLALVVAVVLALAVPTSALISRRIVLLAGLVAGVVPVLWWSHLPLGGLGRATVLLAVLAGALTVAVLWGGPGDARRRAARANPAWRPVDAVLAVSAAGAAWVAAGWLRLSTGAEAVSALLPAWDSSAHVNMVLMLRRFGSTIGSAGAAAPSGQHWKFVDYPQGYHSLVATAIELTNGPVAGSPADEVLAYAHVQGLVIVACAVLLAAAVCALPAARRRPSRALLLSALVVSAFVLGPGGSAVREGFANFTVAGVLTVGAITLASSLPSRHSGRTVLPLVALAGLVVGVAQTWALLLVVALPAALMVVLPLGRLRWPDRRTVGAVAPAAVLLGLGLFGTYRTLSGLEPGKVLAIPGGITTADPGLLGVIVLTALAVTVWPRGTQQTRTRWLVLVPLAGALAVLGVAFIQHREGGGLSYYFWKLFTGVALVCIAVIATSVARWPGAPRPTTRSGFVRLTASLTLAAAASTQLFGFTGFGRGVVPAGTMQTAEADDLLHAATLLADRPGTFLAIDGINPVNAQQWVLALSGTWTTEANDDAGDLLGPGGQPRSAADSAVRVLATPGVVVVAAPQDAGVLRSDPSLAGVADRVLSW
ncbi:hypothetical protein ACPPVS_13395 [Cellulomonas sp. McL0617]|uniref:hypothetical protein n=1 Tax=Cellulomonas sp. McL0617 TaxID=3415675 RepID=UPI003CE9D9C8